MEKLLYIALFAPLVSSLFAALFAQRKKLQIVGVITSLLIMTSFIASSLLLLHLIDGGSAVKANLMDWIVVGDMDIKFGFVVTKLQR